MKKILLIMFFAIMLTACVNENEHSNVDSSSGIVDEPSICFDTDSCDSINSDDSESSVGHVDDAEYFGGVHIIDCDSSCNDESYIDIEDEVIICIIDDDEIESESSIENETTETFVSTTKQTETAKAPVMPIDTQSRRTETILTTAYSTTVSSTVSNTKKSHCTDSEFYMLANLVAHEYGAYWVPTAEKAKVVMTVMNRVRSSKYPNSIKDVILQKNQYCWVPDSYYWKRTTQDCKDAVTYYFEHQDQYSTTLYSFGGDGKKNHFY